MMIKKLAFSLGLAALSPENISSRRWPAIGRMRSVNTVSPSEANTSSEEVSRNKCRRRRPFVRRSGASCRPSNLG